MQTIQLTDDEVKAIEKRRADRAKMGEKKVATLASVALEAWRENAAAPDAPLWIRHRYIVLTRNGELQVWRNNQLMTSVPTSATEEEAAAAVELTGEPAPVDEETFTR